MPRPVMYILSGTSVSPFAFVFISKSTIWSRWSSSLRGRLGSWLYRLPVSQGEMFAPTSQASPFSMRA